MISVMQDGFSTMDFLALIVMSIPFLAGLTIWLSFYIRFDQNVLRQLEEVFLRVANFSEGLSGCSVNNLKLMNEEALDQATPEFQAAWRKVMLQAEKRYTEEILPEGKSFFPKDVLITVPARRNAIKIIWGTVLILLILSIWMPSLIMIFSEIGMGGMGSVFGLISAVVLLLVHLLFTFLDWRALCRTEEAYHRFLYAFDMAVPTASELAGPALLLDATRKNQKAFEKTEEEVARVGREITEAFRKDTEKISGAIDDFANGGVLPALKEAMQKLTDDFILPSNRSITEKLDETLKAVTARQETGMQELANSFAARLSDTLEVRMGLISAALERYQDRMEEQNTRYQNRIDELNRLLEAKMREMASFTENQSRSMERTEEILSRMEELQREGAGSAVRLNEGLGNMLELTEQFRNQTGKFTQDVLSFTEKSEESQLQFGNLVKEITGGMQKAMAGAGIEIAQGINKAVGDNAKAISDLTVQAQALREDYELFFTRNEETAKTTLEEMDYQVQGLITRMSEEIGTMLQTTIARNGEILSQYKDQTAGILTAFDEQARSISLYAKEINMDISELSTNLGVSITEFNEKMREGLSLTIGDFDQGLAELTNRIANTVESITEAVEVLPERIKMESPGR